MKQIQGTFSLPSGAPAAGATVFFKLSAPANCSIGLLTEEEFSVILDDTGSIPAGFTLWTQDEFLAAGTYYVVRLVDPQYGQVLFEQLLIVGSSPVNLGTLTPIFAE